MTTSTNHEQPERFALPGWPVLRVFGPDAGTWLNGIITCDVLSVKEGRGVWGSLLTKQGKIQADLHVIGSQQELFILVAGESGLGEHASPLEPDVSPAPSSRVLATLDGYLIMEDAEIEQIEAEAFVAIGERAIEHLSRAPQELGSPRALAREVWGPTPITLAVLDRKNLTDVRSALANGEAETSGPSLLTPEQWLAFRTEEGLPTYGVDYSEKDNPHAASLERRTVDWQKGCYLGQEVVCMQDMRGKVKRRLMSLRFPGEGAISLPAAVEDAAGEVVGHLTSAAPGVALASLSAPHFEVGTDLRIADGARRIPAEVHPLRK